MDQVLRKQWMLAEQDQRISEAIEREQRRLRSSYEDACRTGERQKTFSKMSSMNLSRRIG